MASQETRRSFFSELGRLLYLMESQTAIRAATTARMERAEEIRLRGEEISNLVLARKEEADAHAARALRAYGQAERHDALARHYYRKAEEARNGAAALAAQARRHQREADEAAAHQRVLAAEGPAWGITL